MVIKDYAQLTSASAAWIERLRTDRSSLLGMREKLQRVASGSLEKDALSAIEHFENQTDIQLTNINHLKHMLKEHARQLERSKQGIDSAVAAELLEEHGRLSQEYRSLDVTISTLKSDFEAFAGKVSA